MEAGRPERGLLPSCGGDARSLAAPVNVYFQPACPHLGWEAESRASSPIPPKPSCSGWRMDLVFLTVRPLVSGKRAEMQLKGRPLPCIGPQSPSSPAGKQDTGHPLPWGGTGWFPGGFLITSALGSKHTTNTCRKHVCSAFCPDARPTIRKLLGIFIPILLGPSGLDTGGARALTSDWLHPWPSGPLTGVGLSEGLWGRKELGTHEEEAGLHRKHLLSTPGGTGLSGQVGRLESIKPGFLLGPLPPQPVSCNQIIRFSIEINFSSLSGALWTPPA